MDEGTKFFAFMLYCNLSSSVLVYWNVYFFEWKYK